MGREVNGDPFSTGVKQACGEKGRTEGGGDGQGRKGERNRLWTSKYDKQVSQSTKKEGGKAGRQCSPSVMGKLDPASSRFGDSAEIHRLHCYWTAAQVILDIPILLHFT